jgi:outer membrane biosynthesis protein TonB
VIRTIWLGFTFLVVLAGVGAFRFAFGNFDAANASAIARPEVNYIVVAKTGQPAPVIGEPLPKPFVLPASALSDAVRVDAGTVDVANADAAKVDAVKDENIWPELSPQPLPALVATGSPGPDRREPAPETRNVGATEPKQAKPAESRQKKASEPRQKPAQNAVRKTPKKEAVAGKDQETAEPKTCQAEEFDALRWAFKLPTGCWS